MTLQTRAATPDDVPQAIALLAAIWPGQANEAMLTRVPGYELHQTRVVVVDGQVVAMAQVVEREMWIGERTVKLGYVGNVLRLPLFFNVDFLFGTIPLFVVLHLFGWGPAV